MTDTIRPWEFAPKRRHGQVVRQRIANPLPPVRIWVPPLIFETAGAPDLVSSVIATWQSSPPLKRKVSGRRQRGVPLVVEKVLRIHLPSARHSTRCAQSTPWCSEAPRSAHNAFWILRATPGHSWHLAPLPPFLRRLSTRSEITWIKGRQGTIAPRRNAESAESAIEQHLLNLWWVRGRNEQETPRRRVAI